MQTASDLIQILDQLCACLVQSSVSVGEIAALLGEVEEEGDEFSPTTVRPASAALESAAISQEWESGEPSDVLLRIPAGVEFPVTALRDRFGDLTSVPMLPSGGLPSIHCEVDPGSSSHVCALFASVEAGPSGVEQGLVRELILRRDIRLE